MSLLPDSRYAGLAIVADGGRRGLALRSIPAPADDPDAFVHVLVAGETLDVLARRYYGSETQWWRIADANSRRLAIEWAPGDELVIPSLRASRSRP